MIAQLQSRIYPVFQQANLKIVLSLIIVQLLLIHKTNGRNMVSFQGENQIVGDISQAYGIADTVIDHWQVIEREADLFLLSKGEHSCIQEENEQYHRSVNRLHSKILNPANECKAFPIKTFVLPALHLVSQFS